MPTSGTHITVLQRLIKENPDLKKVLGDPDADDLAPENKMYKFAALGAIGPDLLFSLLDMSQGGSTIQDLENVLIKIGGTFSGISEFGEKLGRYVDGTLSDMTMEVYDELKQSFNFITGTAMNGLLVLTTSVYNPWTIFRPVRQSDKPRENWFWVDYLHYIKTGAFTQTLLENCKHNPNLYAFALGYLTHYVTDVVGHPYVNQVSQSPWRTYWQRHHLVENYIDAYIWDRWHSEIIPASKFDEQPLDKISAYPNNIGTGAPFTNSRLNDSILIGVTTLGDPVDGLIKKVVDKINRGMFDLGIAEEIESPEPDDPDFKEWTRVFADTLVQVYNEKHEAPGHPENLGKRYAPQNGNGYPAPEDIAAAYGALRLILSLQTENSVKEPELPDIGKDLAEAINEIIEDINKNIAGIPPLNITFDNGKLDLDKLWESMLNTAKWLFEAAKAVGETIFELIVDLIKAGMTVVTDTIKVALAILNKFLYSIYNYFRDMLVLNAYMCPFTGGITNTISKDLSAPMLWCSKGDHVKYPVEEIASEREEFFSGYKPYIPPVNLTDKQEQPVPIKAAPYTPEFIFLPSGQKLTLSLLPDIFIDTPVKGEMFMETSVPLPQQKVINDFSYAYFENSKQDFGGALGNCVKAINLALTGFPSPYMLPDYNMDGDRGYAWPAWDVSPSPKTGQTNTNYLDPEKYSDKVAKVNSVKVKE